MELLRPIRNAIASPSILPTARPTAVHQLLFDPIPYWKKIKNSCQNIICFVFLNLVLTEIPSWIEILITFERSPFFARVMVLLRWNLLKLTYKKLPWKWCIIYFRHPQELFTASSLGRPLSKIKIKSGIKKWVKPLYTSILNLNFFVKPFKRLNDGSIHFQHTV